MKHFFGKYGFTILSALTICALLVIVSPLGKQIGDGVKGQADSLGTLASTSIDYVGIPSTLGYKPKDVVEIGGKNYVILQDRGSNRYLVMDINGIGAREFNTDGNRQDPNKCYIATGGAKPAKETCNNQYEASNIDQYLNGEYYNSLPQNIKESIVSTNIQQEVYAHTASNPKYIWVSKGDMNYDGCNNGACVLQPDGKWVPWNQHTPIRGQMGVYKFRSQGNIDDFGNETRSINRKVYLPSIREVSSIVNVDDQWEMDKFLRHENGNYMYMWFRDARDSYREDAMYGISSHRSLLSVHVRTPNRIVRPAFVIDLKAYIDATTN